MWINDVHTRTKQADCLHCCVSLWKIKYRWYIQINMNVTCFLSSLCQLWEERNEETTVVMQCTHISVLMMLMLMPMIAWCYFLSTFSLPMTFSSSSSSPRFFFIFAYIFIKYIIFPFFSYYFTLFALSINISLWCLHLKSQQRVHTKWNYYTILLNF